MILIHLLIGAFCASLLFILYRFVDIKKIHLSKWKWALILSEIFYLVFVLELIVSFVEEGAPKAALVMGSLFGFIAIIGAVLLGRFVFKVKKQ